MLVLDFLKVLVELVLYIYMLIILARAVLSWVGPDPANPVVRFIHDVTEPVLHRVRSTIPAVYAGIDFSPLIVLLGLYFLRGLLSGGLFLSLAEVITTVLNAYMLVIFVRAGLSWVGADPYNPIVRFIHTITEPVLYRVRKAVPLVYGGMDFSPVAVLLVLYLLRGLLWSALSVLRI